VLELSVVIGAEDSIAQNNAPRRHKGTLQNATPGLLHVVVVGLCCSPLSMRLIHRLRQCALVGAGRFVPRVTPHPTSLEGQEGQWPQSMCVN
jgi:hypothetical protein